MNEPYVKINVILAALLAGLFAYSFFSPSLSRNGMTVPSSCEGMPAAYCKSRGLTRAFAALMRGQTDEAEKLNRYSVSVFTFFAVQLAARIGFSFFFLRRRTPAIVSADIILSTTYFLLTFVPLVVPG